MNDAADEDLTALLDGQLAEPKRSQVLARLLADPVLQDRFGALARARGSIDSAFAGMLAQAPVARLRATLPPASPKPRGSTLARARTAASLAVAALLGAALAAWLTWPVENGRENWTSAVVDYMRLYTPETFAGLSLDPERQAAIAGKVGARLGVAVTPRDLTAPGLAFKTAFVLSYDDLPLGEFVFVDSRGAPYLFCILAEPGAPAPLRRETRQGYAMATWGSRDRRFLVIGPSDEAIREWSATLAARL